jgi:hypothetical protein
VSALASLREGVQRTIRASSVVAIAWAVTVAVTVPLALSVAAAIASHLNASLAAGTVADGADHDWLDEFAAAASGIASTLGPAVIGFAAIVHNTSGFVDRVAPHPTAAMALAVYVLLWTFVSGGILDRLGTVRDVRPPFLQVCGALFGRFLRLNIIQSIVLVALFNIVQPWLLDDVFYELTADVAVERTAFFIRLALYLLFALALALPHVLFDYAKVRMVLEDRRSAVGALRAAGRLLRRHAGRIAALYAANVALLLAVIGAYALVAPGAGSAGWLVWAGFIVSQVYIAARLWARLVFWASEAALFEMASGFRLRETLRRTTEASAQIVSRTVSASRWPR